MAIFVWLIAGGLCFIIENYKERGNPDNNPRIKGLGVS